MPLVLQFVKFGIVGVSNTLISFAMYTLLLKVFGVWYVAASGIGFAVGAVNGFLWNRAWTFRGHVGDASDASALVRGAELAACCSTSVSCTCSSTVRGSTSWWARLLTTVIVTVTHVLRQSGMDVQRRCPEAFAETAADS